MAVKTTPRIAVETGAITRVYSEHNCFTPYPRWDSVADEIVGHPAVKEAQYVPVTGVWAVTFYPVKEPPMDELDKFVIGVLKRNVEYSPTGGREC